MIQLSQSCWSSKCMFVAGLIFVSTKQCTVSSYAASFYYCSAEQKTEKKTEKKSERKTNVGMK